MIEPTMSFEINNETTSKELLSLLKTTIRMKAHAMGGVFKNFSKKVLMAADELRHGESIAALDDETKAAAHLFNEMSLYDTVMKWITKTETRTARNGNVTEKVVGRFNKDYLDDSLSGLVWSKLPLFYIGFDLHPNGNGYQYVPMVFTAYGGFERRRKGTDTGGNERKWDLVFSNATLEEKSNAGRIAEIEVVITNPTVTKKWAGTLALEHAIVDLIARKKGGGPKYEYLLLLTGKKELVPIATKHGFTRAIYSYKEVNRVPGNRRALPADTLKEKYAMIYKNEVHENRTAGRALYSVLTNGEQLDALRKSCVPTKSRPAWRRCV
jgi:hypothetical protein